MKYACYSGENKDRDEEARCSFLGGGFHSSISKSVGGAVMKEKNILYKNTDFPEWRKAIIPNIAASIFLIALFTFLFLFFEDEDIYKRIFMILIPGLFVGVGVLATIPIVVLDDKGLHLYTLLFGKKAWYCFCEYTQIARVTFNEDYHKLSKLRSIKNNNLKEVFLFIKLRKRGSWQRTFGVINIKYLPNFEQFLKVLESKEVPVIPMPPEYFRNFGDITFDLREWIWGTRYGRIPIFKRKKKMQKG